MLPIVLAVVVGLALLGLSVLIDKFLNPLMARRNFMKWSSALRKKNQKTDLRMLEKVEYGTLTPDEVSLRAKGRKGEAVTFAWTEVEEIHAFKRDLFATDLICLRFILSGDRAVEINEEMAGYHDLQSLLQRKFPEMQVNWFADVAFPAFATSHRIIWRKTKSTERTST